MAYLMTDVAAGSNAALQMQKNMAAAPYVQQETAAAAEETQLKLQQDRIKAQYAGQEAAAQQQQAQANLQKTTLGNLITQSGISDSAEKRDIVKEFMADPANKTLTPSESASKLSSAMMGKGFVEEGQSLSKQSVDEAYKQALTDQKLAVQAHEAISTARATVNGAKDEEQFQSLIKQFPSTLKKTLTDKIPNFFEEKDWVLQKSQLDDLLATDASRSKDKDRSTKEYIQELIDDRVREHNKVMEDKAVGVRGGKGVGKDGTQSATAMREASAWIKIETAINRDFKKELDAAEAAVKSASKNEQASTLFGIDIPFTGKKGTFDAENEKYRAIQLDRVQTKLDRLERMPDSDYKDKVYDSLMGQFKMLQTPTDFTSKPIAEPTPKPTAAPAGAPAPIAKPDVTSSKNTAPPEAVDMLTKDPSEKNKKFFKETFGYLPPEFEKTSAPVKTAATEPAKPKRDYGVYQKSKEQLNRLEKDAPPKTISVKTGVGVTTKEVSNPEYEAWYKKNQAKVDELTAQMEANK